MGRAVVALLSCASAKETLASAVLSNAQAWTTEQIHVSV